MVCKFVGLDSAFRDLASFILTKWYVNKELDNLLVTFYKSFILTKWYVNINKVMKSDKGAFMFYIN